MNTMSGIVSSIFMIVAVAAFKGGTDSKFVVVLDIAISTTLISYLWIFPAALKLLTLGTLAVITLFAVVGYATGREVREKQVAIPIAEDLAPEAAVT